MRMRSPSSSNFLLALPMRLAVSTETQQVALLDCLPLDEATSNDRRLSCSGAKQPQLVTRLIGLPNGV
jgi:hypothetical protein